MFGKLVKGIKFLVGVPTGVVTEISGDALIGLGRGIKWTGDKTEKAGWGIISGSQYLWTMSGTERDLKEERTKERMLDSAYRKGVEPQLTIEKHDLRVALKCLPPGEFDKICNDVVEQTLDASQEESIALCLVAAYEAGLIAMRKGEEERLAEKSKKEKEKEIEKAKKKQRRKKAKQDAEIKAAEIIADEEAKQDAPVITPAETQEVIDAPPATV